MGKCADSSAQSDDRGRVYVISRAGSVFRVACCVDGGQGAQRDGARLPDCPIKRGYFTPSSSRGSAEISRLSGDNATDSQRYDMVMPLSTCPGHGSPERGEGGGHNTTLHT